MKLEAIERDLENGYATERDLMNGYQYYARAAIIGHAGGKRQMGYCLHTGMGTEDDIVESAKYYKSAAEARDVDALCKYPRYLLYGNGVKKIRFLVRNFWKLRQVPGRYTLVRLGDCFIEGLGVHQDVRKGLCLQREASGKLHLTSLAQKGIFREYGTGTTQNGAKTEMCLETTARGCPDALNNLARFY